MIRSMTGFGTAMAEESGAHYVVEVRSVNNKFFKAAVRLPEELHGLEPEIESVLAARLSRGSVLATVRFQDNSAEAAARINHPALQRYLEQLLAVPGLTHGATRIDLGALLSLPGVVASEPGHERLERARGMLLRLTSEACDHVLSMRAREGRALHDDLLRHCRVLEGHLSVIAGRAPVVVEMYQQRLRQRMETLLAEVGASVREEDLLREVAIFADRSDISEEVARLQGHLAQFREIVAAADGDPAGRTLDFISQEMLREANTIASKCLDVEVSRRIVEIKGTIDRLKEQAQNVE
jgi:uncharacterized protein (TIGR00255 family)